MECPRYQRIREALHLRCDLGALRRGADRGRAAILREWSKVHQGNGWAVVRKVTLAIKDQPKVQMLRPDIAAIFIRMDFLADGKVLPDQKRTLIIVADKSGDGWRINAGQLTK